MRCGVMNMTPDLTGEIGYPHEALSQSSVSGCRIKSGCLECVDLPMQLLNERISYDRGTRAMDLPIALAWT